MAKNHRSHSKRARRPPRPRATSPTTLTVVVAPLTADPYGEFEVVLAIDDAALVVAVDVGFRPLEPTRIRSLVERAARARGLPGSFLVRDAALVDAIRPVAGSVPITVGPLPAQVDALLALQRRHLEAHRDAQPGAHGTPVGVPSYAPEILRAGERIERAAPWTITNDSEPITISIDGERLTHDTFIVLGAAGQVFGVMGYTNVGAWQRHSLAVTLGRAAVGEFEDQIGLIFYTPDEMSRPMRKEFRSRGYQGQMFPVAVRARPNDPQGRPIESTAEARTLALVCDALASFFERDLVRCEPHREAKTFTYETAIGPTASVTYHGWVDPRTGRTYPGPDDDDVPGPGQSQPLAVTVLGPWLDFDHRLVFDRVDAAFLVNAARDAPTRLGPPWSPSEFPTTTERVPTIMIKSSIADARRAARQLGEATAMLDVPPDQSSPGLLVLARDETPLAIVTAEDEYAGLFATMRALVAPGEEFWVLMAGGGVQKRPNIVEADRAVIVRRLVYRRLSSSEWMEILGARLQPK